MARGRIAGAIARRYCHPVPIDPDPDLVAEIRTRLDAFHSLVGKTAFLAGYLTGRVEMAARAHGAVCPGCATCEFLRDAVSAGTAMKIEMGPPGDWSQAG